MITNKHKSVFGEDANIIFAIDEIMKCPNINALISRIVTILESFPNINIIASTLDTHYISSGMSSLPETTDNSHRWIEWLPIPLIHLETIISSFNNLSVAQNDPNIRPGSNRELSRSICASGGHCHKTAATPK